LASCGRPERAPGAHFFPREDGRWRLRWRSIPPALIPALPRRKTGWKAQRIGASGSGMPCGGRCVCYASTVPTAENPLLPGKRGAPSSIYSASVSPEQRTRPAIHVSRARSKIFLLFICSSAPKCGVAASARGRKAPGSTTSRSGCAASPASLSSRLSSASIFRESRWHSGFSHRPCW
jgi:hypothetical protein